MTSSRLEASEFVAYVGSPEIHDATLQRFERADDILTVFLKAYEGHAFAIRFHGVVFQDAHGVEGMLLYALCEMRWTAPLRKFSFAPWEEEASGRLEIVAADLEMLETLPSTVKDGTS